LELILPKLGHICTWARRYRPTD